MKKLVLCLFVMCMVQPVRADLYSALNIVYKTNPIIEQRRTVIDSARAQVKSATTGLQPYLGISGNAGAARTKIGEYTFDYSPVQYGIEFQQNLFQGGAVFAQIKGAKSELAAANANLYAVQQKVFLDAINAYIEVLNAGAILKLNENNQRVLGEYYKYVSDVQAVGRLTKTDVAQAAARLEMAKYSVADANAKYDNALETYKRIFGTENKNCKDVDLEPVEHFFPIDIDSAQEDALNKHPILMALAAQEEAVKQNITVAYNSMLPSVDVRGTIQKIDDVPYLDDVRDSRIGVYLKMPLYDKGNAFANVEQVRANVAGIQQEIINARRVITENLHQAWNMYQAQQVAISAAQASMDANKMALDGIRDEQAQGRRTVLDVLNAEQELLNSRVAHTRAKHAQISAFFAVLSALGELTPENLGLVE